MGRSKSTQFLSVAVSVLGAAAGLFVEVPKVNGNSMIPTLKAGQHILVMRYQVLKKIGLGIHRGDLVILRGPEGKKEIVKRVIAMAGDSIYIDSGIVFVNGQAIHEPYAHYESTSLRDNDEWPAGVTHERIRYVSIPDGHIFVMGDNRSESTDSRSWGSVPLERVVGEVFVK